MSAHHHGHQHGTAEPEASSAHWTAEFWDERYSSIPALWSGHVNAVVVTETEALSPGTALDVGCGEGGDALWLAGRGWQVEGVDVSQVALDRAARHAAEAVRRLRLPRSGRRRPGRPGRSCRTTPDHTGTARPRR